MERILTQRFAGDVARGLELMPPRVLERIGPVHWWEGDLGFAGHWHESTPDYASAFSPEHFRQGGRNADRCCSTVAFAGPPRHRHLQTVAVLHELGHHLQFALGSYGDWPWPVYNLIGLPPMKPLTTYKEDVYCEQFSEAVSIWLAPQGLLTGRLRQGAERLWEENRAVLTLLNELADWPGDLPPRALRAG